jgi:hypothetical protein
MLSFINNFFQKNSELLIIMTGLFVLFLPTNYTLYYDWNLQYKKKELEYKTQEIEFKILMNKFIPSISMNKFEENENY